MDHFSIDIGGHGDLDRYPRDLGMPSRYPRDLDMPSRYPRDLDTLRDSDKIFRQPRSRTESGIPKIFMQTWKNNDVPERWKESPIAVKKHMPGYKYFLMTDEDNRNFCEKHFPDFLPYYDAFPHPIQRADAIRYMWLYINGGIYMDLDMLLKGNLDHLFASNADVYLVPSGNIHSCYTNAFMASKPGCRLWLEAIEEMKTTLPYFKTMTKHIYVMHSTGPMMLTRAANKTTIPIMTLPSTLLTPYSVCDDYTVEKAGTLIQPLEGSSWCGADTSFYLWWFCNWKPVVWGVIIILVIILLFFLIFGLDNYCTSGHFC